MLEERASLIRIIAMIVGQDDRPSAGWQDIEVRQVGTDDGCGHLLGDCDSDRVGSVEAHLDMRYSRRSCGDGSLDAGARIDERIGAREHTEVCSVHGAPGCEGEHRRDVWVGTVYRDLFDGE